MSARSSFRPSVISGAITNGAVPLFSGVAGVVTSNASLPIANLGNGTFSVVTSSVTGTQDNLNIGIVGNTYVEWSGASDATITGVTLGASGKVFIFKNTGSNVAYFSHLSGSSSAANQFTNIVTSSTTPVASGGWVSYAHDGTNWKLSGHEQGDYITPAFSAGDYTLAGDRTWTVAAGDVTTHAWKLTGRTLQVMWELNTTTISGGTSSTSAQIAMPNGYTSQKDVLMVSSYFILQGANIFTGISSVAASGTVIFATKADQTDLGVGTDNMYFYGQFIGPVT